MQADPNSTPLPIPSFAITGTSRFRIRLPELWRFQPPPSFPQASNRTTFPSPLSPESQTFPLRLDLKPRIIQMLSRTQTTHAAGGFVRQTLGFVCRMKDSSRASNRPQSRIVHMLSRAQNDPRGRGFRKANHGSCLPSKRPCRVSQRTPPALSIARRNAPAA